MGFDNNDDLIFNTSPRIPVCICLDLSEDLKNNCFFPNEELMEKELNQFINDIGQNSNINDSVELCIVEIDTEPKVLRNFITVEEPEKIKIEYKGSRDINSSILKGYETLKERVELYKENGIEYYNPWMIVISGGKSQKNSNLEIRNTIIELEKNNEMHIVPVYIGEDYEEDEELRNELSSLSGVNNTAIVKLAKFGSLFNWINKNISIPNSVCTIELDYADLTEWSDI